MSLIALGLEIFCTLYILNTLHAWLKSGQTALLNIFSIFSSPVQKYRKSYCTTPSIGIGLALAAALVLAKMLKFYFKVFKTLYFLNPQMDLIYIWFNYRCWSKILLSTVHTPAQDLEVKVTHTEIYFNVLKILLISKSSIRFLTAVVRAWLGSYVGKPSSAYGWSGGFSPGSPVFAHLR